MSVRSRLTRHPRLLVFSLLVLRTIRIFDCFLVLSLNLFVCSHQEEKFQTFDLGPPTFLFFFLIVVYFICWSSYKCPAWLTSSPCWYQLTLPPPVLLFITADTWKWPSDSAEKEEEEARVVEEEDDEGEEGWRRKLKKNTLMLNAHIRTINALRCSCRIDEKPTKYNFLFSPKPPNPQNNIFLFHWERFFLFFLHLADCAMVPRRRLRLGRDR